MAAPAPRPPRGHLVQRRSLLGLMGLLVAVLAGVVAVAWLRVAADAQSGARAEALAEALARYAGRPGGAAELSAALAVADADPVVAHAWVLEQLPDGPLAPLAATPGAPDPAAALGPAGLAALLERGGPAAPGAPWRVDGPGLPSAAAAIGLGGAADRPGFIVVQVDPAGARAGAAGHEALYILGLALLHLLVVGGIVRALDRRLLGRLARIAAQVRAWSSAPQLDGPALGADHDDALGQLGLDLDMLRARFHASQLSAQEAAASAAEAAAELRATLAAIPDELFEVDAEGMILAHRDSWSGAPGAPISARRPLRAAFHPAAAAALEAVVAQARAAGVATGAPLGLPGPAGLRWVEPAAAARAGRVHDGRVLLQLRDVTPRVASEQALIASEQRFRELFELSPLGFALLNGVTGEVLRFNRAMQRILSGVAPTTYVDLCVGLDPTALGNISVQMRELDAFGPIEVVLRPGGRPVPVLASAVRFTEPDGQTVIWVLVQDVRELRAYQDHLVASRGALEAANARLSELNAELHASSVQLAVAYEQARGLAAVAESASRAKSAFLARMSHELRTPLNPIVGAGELLRAQAPSPAQRELADNVVQHGLKLLRLLSDVLLYAELQSDGHAVSLSSCRAAAVAEAALARWAEAAARKGLLLRLVSEVSAGVELRTDPALLGQALDQLLDNAIKFTAAGEVCLRVRAMRGRLRLEVEDTGPGVNPEELQRLVLAFEQADGSSTRAHDGAGLGLAIVREVARALRGSMGLGRGAAGGALAWIDLPEGEGSSGPALSLRRAAVVDSGAFGRVQLSMLLESWGCAVSLFAAPAEAAAAFAAEEKDSVLDVVFVAAELHGAEVGLVIDAARRHPSRPTVVMVGGPAPAPYTGLPVVPRPVTPPGLYDRLAEALSAQRPRGPVEPHSAPVRADATTLLLVEDNIVNQQLAVMLLERLGYSVDVAADGAEALSRLRAQRYGLVLMDCMMPVMDGYACTAALRRGEAGAANASLPVIAVTANAMKGDEQRCLDAGMDDYIAKPVRAEALRERVERWLGKRSAKAQLPPG